MATLDPNFLPNLAANPVSSFFKPGLKPSEQLRKTKLDYDSYHLNLLNAYNLPQFKTLSSFSNTQDNFWALQRANPLAPNLIIERLKANQFAIDHFKLPPPSSSNFSGAQLPTFGQKEFTQLLIENGSLPLPGSDSTEVPFQFDLLQAQNMELNGNWIKALGYEIGAQNFEKGLVGSVGGTAPARENSNYYRIEGKVSKNFRIAAINGIRKNKEGMMELGQMLYGASGGYQIDLLHNATQGLLADAGEWILSREGKHLTPSIAMTIQFIQHHFEHTPEKELFLISHSCGGSILKAALREIPPEQREKIIVHNMGGGAYIPKTLCKNSVNYVSSRDFVSFISHYLAKKFIDSPMNLFKLNDYKFILLKPQPGSKSVDHGIMEPTYRPRVEHIVSKYCNAR